MNITEQVNHEFEPVFDKNSRVLVLGTFPSVKSRENQFLEDHRTFNRKRSAGDDCR